MAAGNGLRVRIDHSAVGGSGGCRSERELIFDGGLKTSVCLCAELRWSNAGFTNGTQNVDFLHLRLVAQFAGFLSILSVRR